MGRKQWLLAGKIGGALVLAAIAIWSVWSMSAYQTRSEVLSEQRAERSAEDIESACGGLAGPPLVDCVTRQVEDSRDDQRAEYDLAAQQGMSIWAFWTMIAAVTTTGLTVVALVFIKGTLEATRMAVKDTGDATKAMLDANRIAEDAQRGWVTVTIHAIGPVYRGDDGRVLATIRYELKNVGVTPIAAGAHSASVYHAGNGPEGAKRFTNLLESFRKAGLASTGLAPGETLPVHYTVVVSDKDLIATEGKGYIFQVMVGITYQTRSLSGASFKSALLLPAGREGFPTDSGPWTVEDVGHLVLGSSMG